MALQRHHAQHRGVSGGPDGHGLLWRERLWQGHEPLTFEPRLLRQAAPVVFAYAPAIEHHLVAHFAVWVAGCFHRAHQIDARHHRELADHGAATGDGQTIFVVQRGVADPHRDIAFGQLAVFDFLHRGTVAAVILLDQDSFEHGGSFNL